MNSQPSELDTVLTSFTDDQPLQASSLLDPRLNECGTGLRETEDMTPVGEESAELRFGPGKLRYFVMRLPHRSLSVRSMTRHLHSTQCLGSAEGLPFWMLLAPPETQGPTLAAKAAWLLRVMPGEGLKLHIGTWHAGPYFPAKSALFFNLELADTYKSDHETLPLSKPVQIILN